MYKTYHSKDLTRSISETNFSIPFVSSSTTTPSLNLTITKCLNSSMTTIFCEVKLATGSLIYKHNLGFKGQITLLSWSVNCQNPTTHFITMLAIINYVTSTLQIQSVSNVQHVSTFNTMWLHLILYFYIIIDVDVLVLVYHSIHIFAS